jgi:hypothetical protein
MRVQVKEAVVKSKSVAAQRASIGGIVILIVAVAISFLPSIPYYVAIAYALSLVGLLLTSWSSRTSNKWMGELRPDMVLAKALKSLGGAYFLYNYALPVDHILLTPFGLTALTVRLVDGEIRCNGDSWSRRLTLGRIFRALGEEQLGNPTRLAERDVARLEAWVQSQLPDAIVPVDSLIVFTNPDADLECSEPEIPTFQVGDLKDYLRKRTSDTRLSPEVSKDLKKLLNELVR